MATAKQPAASETSESIEEQVKAYLKKGGEIQQIESGVSGQQSMGERKHINLGNSSTQKPETNAKETS